MKANGIEIHVRSAFLQGLLLMPLDQVKIKKPDAYKPLLRLHQFADDLGLTPLQLGLNFIQSIKDVDHIIVGASSCRQLKEVLMAVNTNVSSKDCGHLSVHDHNIIDPRMW